MQLTPQFAVDLRDMFRKDPLAPDEVRKIPDMDDWFVTSAGTTLDPKECEELFRIKIDDVSVVVYKCLNNSQAGSA